VSFARMLALFGLGLIATVLRSAEPLPGPVHFQTSDRCFACHNGLADAAGNDVSIGLQWSASLMANSARDPYWQASVRRETLDLPRSARAIEDECAACHMPMMRYRARLAGRQAEVLRTLALPRSARDHREGLDGVSCSLCHQISPEGLGSPETWNGHFHIAEAPAGRGVEFGPQVVDAGRQRIMRSATAGLEPRQGNHIRRSELCASCHTLRTEALDGQGRVVGSLPEQMPFEEWRHSAFVDRQSCQDCHMPRAQGPLTVSSVLGQPHQDMARHVFVGANFLVQRMLDRYRDSLEVTAPSPLLQEAAARTRDFLAMRSATVHIATLREGASLRARVEIRNLGGHKLPTAYPSRRAWLHVRVLDATGKVLLESGALRPDGSVEGNDNDIDAARFEPHHREIRSSDQVQVYESILRDGAGRVTTSLLAATGYLKDNRLLPEGFDKRSAGPDIAVVGAAFDDPDFSQGGHVVDYLADASGREGPFRVEAELLYQPIGHRWALNLAAYDSVETRRFVSYYTAMREETATVLARASAQQP